MLIGLLFCMLLFISLWWQLLYICLNYVYLLVFVIYTNYVYLLVFIIYMT